MKFLANENVAGDAVVALRAKGHDVAWIRDDAPGSRDEDVLARAVTEGRILITFDKDFGELAFHSRLPAKCGIILFRIPAPSASFVANTVVTAIESRTDWVGQFSVVEENRVRMRGL
jgi:predicted nuclease of predicted toxin-antitoxin system